MITIRNYTKSDAPAVGLLIKDTYSEFNLDFLPPDELPPYLGPFAYAGQDDPQRLEDIHLVILSEMVFVAEVDGQITGVLRGRLNRLGSLFVASAYQRRGIGRALVEHFESAVRKQGSGVIRVAASLYAVPFYLEMGYRRSTGIRRGWSFQGHGLPIQPMKKVL
jgi:GNAT superfamily N-acetyltransferase